MSVNRRQYLQNLACAVAGAPLLRAGTSAPPSGIPGAYRGKVVATTHTRCLRGGSYQAKFIREMLNRGLCELTGASDPVEAWRRFFSPDDIVGIKVNPVGHPYVCSSAELLHGILDGLAAVGIKPGRITVFERYRGHIESSPYFAWVPRNVRLGYAAEAFDPVQLDIRGYDPECFVELPFTLPGYDLSDKTATRSHASLFISRDITKLINLPVLKSHNDAGVTLALKNLSHGLVNNASRSHVAGLRFVDFIPAVVSMPAIRQKAVLHILDGTRGLFHGGPSISGEVAGEYVWEHQTLYFATDPVALDIIGRSVIEEKRKEKHLWPLAEARKDDIWTTAKRQPQYIESCGQAGLGESDPAKIDFTPIQLG